MTEDKVVLDNGKTVSLDTARHTLLGLEFILGSFDQEAVENLKAICLGKCDRFHGANAEKLKQECLELGLLKAQNGGLTPASDDIREVALSCIAGSGKKLRIARPRKMPPLK